MNGRLDEHVDENLDDHLSEATRSPRSGPRRGTGRLVVEFIGQRMELTPRERLSFGRRADLELDTNTELGNVVGRFVHGNGFWWLQNEDPNRSLLVLDGRSGSTLVVAPGTATPLTFADAIVRLKAGRAHYELHLRLDVEGLSADLPTAVERDVLVPAVDVSLNREQRLLLVVFAESKLRNPHGPLLLPTNAEAASRLRWTTTKFNRKLDNLCVKFAKLGVPGLRGSSKHLAIDRRRRLTEHCLRAGIIGAVDLDQLATLASPVATS